MLNPALNSTKLTAMETYAQLAEPEYDIPPGGQPPMETDEWQKGVVPLDTLPAAWWNWMWSTITEQEKRIVRFFKNLYGGEGTTEQEKSGEFYNLLKAGNVNGFDDTGTVNNQLTTAIQNIARTPATTAVRGAILSSASGMGTVAVDETTGVATVNGMGSTTLQTTSQTVTAAINELDGDISDEASARQGADNTLQGNIDKKANISHATSDTVTDPEDPDYGKSVNGQGSSTKFGHVKLSDSADSTKTATEGTAVTPKALQDVINMITAQQPFLPGFITMYAGATLPPGWLLCDGSAISRTTYALLFAAIGITWGVGDGSLTFNLPNLIDRAPMGANANVTANQLGKKQDGAVKGHTHGITEPNNGSGHQHSYSAPVAQPYTSAVGTSGAPLVIPGQVGTAYSTTGISINSNDSSQTANVPVNARVNFIIYTGVIPQ